MALLRIELDDSLNERIHYRDVAFPIDICLDVYNMFVDCEVNCHWHDELEIGLMLSGAAEYYINDMHFCLSQGDCIFVNSNVMHMARQADECTDAVMLTVTFPASFVGGGTGSTVYQKYFAPLLHTGVQGFVFAQDNILRDILASKLKQLHELNTNAYGYELKCTELIMHIWHEIITYMNEQDSFSEKRNRRYEERAKQLLSYIHANYSQNITVDDMAASAGIGRSECFRCFKLYTNKKPVEYINEYRLAQAGRLLARTSQPVTDICLACGFSSSSYFGKLFKEKYGVSPLQYRNLAQKQSSVYNSHM